MRATAWLLAVPLLCLMTACGNNAGSANSDSTLNPPAATDADNTARNEEKGGLPDPTAQNQSEKEADRTISAAIRKAVVSDDSLSVNAHNVKIITADGVVTLRGPVKNDQEKTNIEAKAKQVAGVSSVQNLLEVEKNP
jgi:hyperosmotically inducible protein